MAFGINILDRLECPSRPERPPARAALGRTTRRSGRRSVGRYSRIGAANQPGNCAHFHIGDRVGRGRPTRKRSKATRSTWADLTDSPGA